MPNSFSEYCIYGSRLRRGPYTCTHKKRSGSQSQCSIQFAFPIHRDSRIIKWQLKYWYSSLTGFTCFKSLSCSSAGVPQFSLSISSIKLCFFSLSSFNLSYRGTENTIEKQMLKQIHLNKMNTMEYNSKNNKEFYKVIPSKCHGCLLLRLFFISAIGRLSARGRELVVSEERERRERWEGTPSVPLAS